MLGNLLFLAGLLSPEISGEVSTAAGSLVESVGRRLASGIYTEVQARAKQDAGAIAGSLAEILGNGANDVIEKIQDSITHALAGALEGEKVTLVSVEELARLRELAAKVAEAASTETDSRNRNPN